MPLHSAHASLVYLYRLSSRPYDSSHLPFFSSTTSIEAMMTPMISRPNDLHRAVDIERDMTFDVPMDVVAV